MSKKTNPRKPRMASPRRYVESLTIPQIKTRLRTLEGNMANYAHRERERLTKRLGELQTKSNPRSKHRSRRKTGQHAIRRLLTGKRNFPGLASALVEGVGIGAGIFAGERALNTLTKKKGKSNPFPALLAAVGEGAAFGAGEEAITGAKKVFRRRVVKKKKNKRKVGRGGRLVRINLDAFVDQGGTIHPIRGSQGYSSSAAGETRRRKSRDKKKSRKAKSRKPSRKASRKSRKSQRGKRNPHRVTHALRVRSRIIATGSHRQIHQAARLLKAAGVRSQIGRRA